jgi:5-methylcytosine-specific restriction endonuclease McrA
LEATLTDEEWNQILILQNNSCGWCDCFFDDSNPPERDHVIPVSKGGALTFENVQALCRSCNSKKGNKIKDFRWWAK